MMQGKLGDNAVFKIFILGVISSDIRLEILRFCVILHSYALLRYCLILGEQSDLATETFEKDQQTTGSR